MKKAKAIMIQGTGSQVGKSILVGALCRIFAQEGYRVAPFKSQNMSLNSYVTKDGGEIARIQALQAEAAGVEPTVDMNPILLKPKEIGKDTQLIIRGKPYCDVSIKDYWVHGKYVPMLVNVIQESIDKLKSRFDIIVIEGAGCPADVYLNVDIVNMPTAEIAKAPVLLVVDVTCARGGALASVVGIHQLLNKEERDRIRGIIINKCEVIEILKPCFRMIEEKTGWPILGIIPYVSGLVLPDEDSVALMKKTIAKPEAEVEIAIICFPLISNFTDFDPLKLEPGTKVNFIKSTKELRSPDAIIIPGTKNTIRDFLWLKKSGLAEKIVRLAKKGVPVIGICGGFQMLGKKLLDEKGIEGGVPRIAKGLGLIDVTTTFDIYDKTTNQIEAEIIGHGPILDQVRGQRIVGYEIHMGSSCPGNGAKPIFRVLKRGDEIIEKLDGACDRSGLVLGTYIHGIFDDPPLREAFIKFLFEKRGLTWRPRLGSSMLKAWEESLDRLAKVVRDNVNLHKICEIIGMAQINS